MVGRPKSEVTKRREARTEEEELMERAVGLYKQEQQRTDQKPMGLRKVCDQIEAEHRQETGRTVKLNHNTLNNRLKGMKSIGQSNIGRTLLSVEEEQAIVDLTIEYAGCEFPLNCQ